MTDSAPDSRLVQFGEFEIDRQACELRRNGQRVPLQIQPFRVLQFLVDHAGEVVTRATLSASIWPGTVYLDVDHGLNNAINRLRQALGDSGEQPRFIETLPRIGYRFIHKVDVPVAEPPSPSAMPVRRTKASLAIVAVLATIAIGVLTIGLARWALLPTTPVPGTVSKVRTSQVAGAQEAYLRGVNLLKKRNKESLQLAIQQLQRATRLDPAFAPAFATLAEAYVGAGGTGYSKYLSADQALGPALAAAEQALRLDPELGQAHIALARVLNGLQPWSGPTDLAIEQSFRRGLALDPTNADAHLQFGNFLAKHGRGEEAMAQFRLALEKDPMSPSINSRLGEELMAAGETEEGLELLRTTVEMEPFQFNARLRLGWAYATVGDNKAAELEFAAADRISPNSMQALSALAYAAASNGNEAHARELLSEVLPMAEKSNNPLSVAVIYVGLKERDSSIEWLTKTVRQTRTLHRKAAWGIQSPMFDWLRDDPRFVALEKEIGETVASEE